MAGLTLSGIGKSFDDTKVLHQIDLDIAGGEFVAVLGPSGCGKTTLLRVVAGFETPDTGDIRIGGRSVTHVPPEARGIGIVFQNYALWPHMSVAENVGYALKVARLPRAERDARVAAALATVDLSRFADRRPADLSGGQRQRVALARCLAAGSKLVLLDEPLANLDVHLRATMEEEFRRFHRESGATLFYITHDQAEAMAMADRIAVMDKGRILQCAPPRTLYREPASADVARFIGDGILLPAERLRPTGAGRAVAQVLGHPVTLRCAPADGPRDTAIVTAHPADLAFAETGIAARVTARIYRGGTWLYDCRPDADPALRVQIAHPDDGRPAPNLGDATRIAFRDLWAIPAQGATTLTPTELFQCA